MLCCSPQSQVGDYVVINIPLTFSNLYIHSNTIFSPVSSLHSLGLETHPGREAEGEGCVGWEQPGQSHLTPQRQPELLPPAPLQPQHADTEVRTEVGHVPLLQGPAAEEGRDRQPLCLRSQQTGQGRLVPGAE